MLIMLIEVDVRSNVRDSDTFNARFSKALLKIFLEPTFLSVAAEFIEFGDYNLLFAYYWEKFYWVGISVL